MHSLFPVDTLKIDRAFVQDLLLSADCESIVKAIIALAHSLSLKVLAEGVECQAQLDFLRANDCDEVQGFFFSKPILSLEFTQRFHPGDTLG